MNYINILSKKTLTVFIIIAFGLAACSDGDSPTDSAPDDNADVTATITVGSDDPFYFALDIEEGLEGIRLNHHTGDEDNVEVYELTTNWMISDPLVHNISLALVVPEEGTYNKMKEGDNFGVFMMGYSYDLKTFHADHVTVTITDLSEKRVKGTFEGTFYSDDGKKAVIEDGKFDVKPKYGKI